MTDHHPNCTDNLRGALRELGIEAGALPVAFNLFMVADVAADERLTIGSPNCPPGTSIRFRAEMDLAVAVSSCPAGTCNGGEPLEALVLEIVRSSGWED